MDVSDKLHGRNSEKSIRSVNQIVPSSKNARTWVQSPYPLVMTNIAIENDHRNSGFSHEKLPFSIAILT